MPPGPRSETATSAGAARILRELVGLRARETTWVVRDPTSDEDALRSLSAALREIGCAVAEVEVSEFTASPHADPGARCPEAIVSLAAPLLTHTDRMRSLLSQGARYVNLRGLDVASLIEANTVDFASLDVMTRALAQRLVAARTIRVEDANGSDVTFAPATSLALSGLAQTPGSIGGYPGGEAAVVPVDNSVIGLICQPLYVEGFDTPSPTLTVEISNGEVVGISDGAAGSYLRDRVWNPAAGRIVGEFGMGTHPTIAPRSARCAKKRLGTAHFGVGDNRTFGGHVAAPAHIDIILGSPTVRVDDTPLLESGIPVWSM